MRTIVIGDAAFHVGDVRPEFWSAAASGDWERPTFEAIAGQLTPETIVLDFGAWIGPITLFAATKAKRVISFEPDPAAAAELKANIALNPDLAAKITVIEKAVWPQAGDLAMGAHEAQGDSMSSILHTQADVTWRVAAITPAEIDAMVPADAPLFIKMDVEGAEYEIAPALAPLLARRRVAALIYFHPRFAAGSGLSRWTKTIPMTRRVFGMFKGWRQFRVRRHSLKPAPWRERLTAARLICFEARSGYLFVKR
jgi:FkbM family methyltransferase